MRLLGVPVIQLTGLRRGICSLTPVIDLTWSANQARSGTELGNLKN